MIFYTVEVRTKVMMDEKWIENADVEQLVAEGTMYRDDRGFLRHSKEVTLHLI